MRIVAGLAKLLLATVMAGVLVAGLLLPYVAGLGLLATKVTDAIDAANVDDMSQPFQQRTVIEDKDGNPITYIYAQNRTDVGLTDISWYLQQAVISIEDRRFQSNDGVDWQGTLRALLQNTAGDPISGGSTITQQLVKNYLYLVAAQTPTEKADAVSDTLIRKLREAKMALLYHQSHTNDDILDQYLNLVAFGPSVYGAEAASEYFFNGTSAADLTLPEAALLAAMINNPNKFNPLVPTQQDITIQRRNQVLDDMARDQYISQAVADQAKKAPLGVEIKKTPNGCINGYQAKTEGYFCDYVLSYLQNAGVSYSDLTTGGYTIHTTLDPTVMAKATAAVAKSVDPATATSERIANVIAVVQSGGGSRNVLALAANRPYGTDADAGQTVQPLTTTFSPFGAGNIFTLFTAAEAMRRGLGTTSDIDVPTTYHSPLVPSYSFTNSGTFPSTMSLQQALVKTPDTPFVELEDEVGLGNVATMAVNLGLRGYQLSSGDVDRAFAGDSGRTYQQEITAQKIVSFTLGVSPVSPLELANVGATLSTDGLWCPPTPVSSISDETGKQLTWSQQQCTQTVLPALAHTLTSTLASNMTATGSPLAPAAQAAGWTGTWAGLAGTTDNNREASFLGYTPSYSAAVMTWDYLPSPQSLCVSPVTSCTQQQAATKGMTGQTIPEQTWLSAIKPLTSSTAVSAFPPPDVTYLTGQTQNQVPNVIGLSLTNAEAQLQAHGFTVTQANIIYTNTSAAPANQVVDQTPRTSALPGTSVTLTVSTGAGTVASTGTSGASSSSTTPLGPIGGG